MMQIRFEMSGGYAGMFAARPLTYQVAVDELPEPERTALRELVERSGLLTSPPPEPARATPDALTYRLTITSEGRTHQLTLHDPSVPAAVRPLLQYLQQRAIAQRAGTA